MTGTGKADPFGRSDPDRRPLAARVGQGCGALEEMFVDESLDLAVQPSA
jgi:hypothetical protein